MLGTTSNNLEAAAGTHHDPLPGLQVSSPTPTSSCTSCRASFKDAQDQRWHMKSPWHIYNLKRRMASLPPITLEVFVENVSKRPDHRDAFSSNTHLHRHIRSTSPISASKTSSSYSEPQFSPNSCLFCNQSFPCEAGDFTTIIDHVRASHGLFIPRPESILDTECFLAYLNSVVNKWRECLYCGVMKSSVASVKSHMRDRGHCSLNFEREPELWDFWEPNVEEATQAEEDSGVDDDSKVDAAEIPPGVGAAEDTKLHLPTGRLASSKRQAAREHHQDVRNRVLVALSMPAQPPSERLRERPSESSSRDLIMAQLIRPPRNKPNRRDEMSLIGLSPQARHALVLAEKTAQRSEAAARRAKEWSYGKSANLQEFDQLDGKMKWGKQNHKLMPR